MVSFQICGASFKTSNATSSHRKRHFMKLLYCDLCPYKNKEKNSIIMHIVSQSDHQISIQNINAIPAQSLLDPNAMGLHVSFGDSVQTKTHFCSLQKIKHLQRRDYVCQLCGASFGMINALKSHLIQCHENERSIECELCDFKTFNKNKLDRHMKTHTGERNFEVSFWV